jgi:hypothetical protein
MALYLEFERIVRCFEKAKLRYAVAGGLAVGLHGYVRATQDMDFLMHPQDMPRAEAALLQLGYRVNPVVQEFVRAKLTLKCFFKRLPKEDGLMLVDLLVPASAPMQRALERATVIPFGKGSIRVVTAQDLVAMKRLRGSAADKADIEFLRKQP